MYNTVVTADNIIRDSRMEFPEPWMPTINTVADRHHGGPLREQFLLLRMPAPLYLKTHQPWQAATVLVMLKAK